MRSVIEEMGRNVQDRDGDGKVSYAEFEFGTSRRCPRATLRPTRMRLGAVGCGTLSIVVLVRTAMIKNVVDSYKIKDVFAAKDNPPPGQIGRCLQDLGSAVMTEAAPVWLCAYQFFERGS